MTLALSAAAWLLFCLLLWRWGRSVAPADERHPAVTDDGWVLTLHRYRAAPEVPTHPVPVVLAHGILMSRRCWELGPDVSVPRWLAARGYDVWVPEYRGTPSSRAPSGAARWRYDARDHGWSDAPAFLDVIQAITGRPTVSWIGHSMGGIVGALYAARHGSDRLHRFVALGSPMRFGPGRGPIRRALGPAQWLLKRTRRAPLWPLVFLTLPFSVLLPSTGSRLAINPRLLTLRHRAGLFGGAFRDVSAQLHGWFVDLKVGRRTVATDSDAAHMAPGDLGRLVAPLLVVASSGDLIAPPASVLPGWEGAGSSRRKSVLFGGQRNEDPSSPVFGHNDLMCSRAALEHVWPQVVDWLEEGGAPGPDLPEADADAGCSSSSKTR